MPLIVYNPAILCDSKDNKSLYYALGKGQDGHDQGRRVEGQIWLPTQPRKGFFLCLADDAVRDVNRQFDADSLTYSRKAMIMTRMALNTKGIWQVSQLTPDLQRIMITDR